ncbi:MAG: chemotaxis protein CheW, partial [Fibrobacterales bacterium]
MNSMDTINEKELTSNDSVEGKYLTLKLGNEEYGLPILTVQRIIQLQNITPVPRTPDFVRGVINLRGNIIPTLELRTKLQMEKQEDTDSTCIIVVQIGLKESELTMGLIIDAVSEGVYIDSSQLQETPDFGKGIETKFITS